MAEAQGDKTEAPTPRRRQEAIEQGNIPKSQDLSAAVLIISVMLLLDWYGPGLVGALKTVLQEMLSEASLSNFNTDQVGTSVFRSLAPVAAAMAPLFIGVVLAAILVNVAQVGLVFSSKRLEPKLSALNPMKGLGKLFKGGNGLIQLLMNVMKLVCVTAVAYSAVHGQLAQIIAVQQLSFIQIFGLSAGIIYSIALRIGALLLVLAIIDYAYQRYRVERDLKMTKQEVKEEMKRMEGDPQMKHRRKQLAQQMMNKRLQRDVPTADVIVTNPTEFAVALKYDAGDMHAPKVVAKGQDHMAKRIREIAIANGIPILERKPLARALYKMCDVGQEIPEQFYATVAEILAYVYELSGKVKKAG